MKKLFIKSAVLSMMLMAGLNANAQSLGSILSSVSSATSSNNSSSVISTLTSVFSSSKQASSTNIVGSWTYTEPAIVFTSNNVLTQAASKIAAKKIENKLQTQLSQYGIKKGTMSITFVKDGTFTEKIKGKTMTGTWKVSNSKLLLTYGGVKTISLTTQVSGNELQIVTDATKILTTVKAIANTSSNSELKTISSLMSSVKGMKAGLTLTKK